MNENKRQGFTLMELVIVLAVLAIIAAILIPTFINTTDRARLRSDIQSARAIQNAMELFHAERGAAAGDTITAILTTLQTNGFLNAQMNDIQTAGALWALNTTGDVVVDISALAVSENVHRAARGLPDNERMFVTGIRSAP
jgi:type IV pilus assembly protein PilA